MERWDVVVVGARCAGAALSIRLARRGARVIMVERDALGSDMPMSTHLVHPPGMDELDALGVGASLCVGAPAIRKSGLVADDAKLVTHYPGDRAAYCIRRHRLDGQLQRAALNAGAELLDRTRVVDLVREGPRVQGVVIERDGVQRELRATWVVGADGAHSTVAKLTGVEEYLTVDSPRGGYWFYWPKTRAWDEGAHADHDSLIAYEGSDLRYAFPTDDEQLLLVGAPSAEVARSWGRDYKARYIDFMRASPHTAALVENNAPLGKGIGLLKARFFYRRPIGEGFALVGDAGHTKDFSTGQGISEALLSAHALSDAISVGTPAAMFDFWRERDLTSLPYYFDANRLGALDVNDAMFRLVLAKLAADPKKAGRIGEAMDRRRNPAELTSMPELLGWVFGAVLRGRFDVLRGFMKAGGEIAKDQRAFRERKRAFTAKFDRPALPSAPAPGTVAPA